jgi:hypothetical protein
MTEQQGPEDVEGHMARRDDAADDVEGHGRYLQSEEGDDVEGHGKYKQSEEGDDVEGHYFHRPL